jgi:CRISPR-associated protein Cmr2
MILSQAIATPYKEQARSGMQRDPGGHRYWLKNHASAFLQKRMNEMQELNLATSNAFLPAIAQFPSGSWAVQFAFTLSKPYISKDDTDLYILDNPVKKEWVFKVPYVAPSQWKGTLRAAMVQELVNESSLPEAFAKRRFRMAVLFGDEKGEETGGPKGLAGYLDKNGDLEAAKRYRQLVREHFGGEPDKPFSHHRGFLHFYPTYFDQIGLEMINPQDRETGAGKLPIYFECVPKGAKGTFALLCAPLGGPELSPMEAEKQAAHDLREIAEGIRAMMTSHGFGAKSSSGFGVADVDFSGATVLPSEFKQTWIKGWNGANE